MSIRLAILHIWIFDRQKQIFSLLGGTTGAVKKTEKQSQNRNYGNLKLALFRSTRDEVLLQDFLNIFIQIVVIGFLLEFLTSLFYLLFFCLFRDVWLAPLSSPSALGRSRRRALRISYRIVSCPYSDIVG